MPWVLLTDADLQFDLSELEDFLPLAADADLVVGWRILRRDPLNRRMNAAAWNWLVRRMFQLPVKDVDCAFKLVRRDLVQSFPLRRRGAMISTELVVKCLAAGGAPRGAGRPPPAARGRRTERREPASRRARVLRTGEATPQPARRRGTEQPVAGYRSRRDGGAEPGHPRLRRRALAARGAAAVLRARGPSRDGGARRARGDRPGQHAAVRHPAARRRAGPGEPRRVRGVPHAARAAQQRPDHHADRARLRGRRGARARGRRRRLRRQAVPAGGAAQPHPRGPAALGRQRPVEAALSAGPIALDPGRGRSGATARPSR